MQHLLHPDWDKVEEDLLWLEEPRHHLIRITDPDYPPALREIPDPPPALFIHGNPAGLAAAQLAIVGSRNPSMTGRRIANDFAKALVNEGFAITSGLALGIDAASHRGALAGQGLTLAVTGTGLDRVYPAKHKQLAHEIAERGALISEFPLGSPAKAAHFPRRNRIISGLSLGVLVVEAATQSGSLITARLALEQGREVFAIPGSIYNPLAKGCNALIREGAKLVETVEDILEEIGRFRPLSHPADAALEPKNEATLEKDYLDLLKSIAYDPMSIDTLVEETGLAPEALSSMLLVLELHGYVASAAGGCYYRVS